MNKPVNEMRQARKSAGLSLDKLARATGYAYTSIFNVEMGSVKAWPKIKKRISEVLGVPETQIFDERGWVKNYAD